MFDKKIDTGEFKGTQGMIYYNLLTGYKTLNSHKSETTFVDKNMRGTGLFEKLYARAIDKAINSDSNLIWGFTALGTIWEKKLGFQCDKAIIHEAYLITRTPQTTSFSRKLYYSIRSLRTRVRMLFLPEKKLKFLDSNEAIISLNQLNDKFSPESIHLDYACESVQNRIFRSPVINYQFAEILENGQLMGIFIFHVKNEQLLISDFIYVGNQNIEALIKSLHSKISLTNRICSIRFWGNSNYPVNSTIFNAFKRLGAKIELVDNMQFVFKPTPPLEIKSSNLVINGLWTEGFTY